MPERTPAHIGQLTNEAVGGVLKCIGQWMVRSQQLTSNVFTWVSCFVCLVGKHRLCACWWMVCFGCGSSFNTVYHHKSCFGSCQGWIMQCLIFTYILPYLNMLRFHRQTHWFSEDVVCRVCSAKFMQIYETWFGRGYAMDYHNCSRETKHVNEF